MHEPTSSRNHLVVVSTAAVGLLLVAVLAVMMTPGSAPPQVASPAAPASAPAAVSPSTSAVPPASALASTAVSTGANTETSTTVMIEVTVVAATTTATTATTLVMSTLVATTALVRASTDANLTTTVETLTEQVDEQVDEQFAVPVGSDGLALMATPGHDIAVGEVMSVRLPDGADVDALVVATAAAGMVVVSVPERHVEGYESAPPEPTDLGPDDTVHVHGPNAEIVTLAALAELDVADGTPLTDAAGQLVGLCLEDTETGETTMLVIDRAVVDAIDARD